MYLGAPFVFAALQQWPNFRTYCSGVGLGIIVLALIISSFSQRVWHLILTQGVLYAIGGTMLYMPAILFLDEWFIQRKGFAYGVMWAGTGVGGISIPFLMNWGLGKYGSATSKQFFAINILQSDFNHEV